MTLKRERGCVPAFLFYEEGSENMNNILGNYVHYNQNNYKNFGINRINEDPSENWSQAVANLKSQLNVSNDLVSLMTEAKELEDLYNSLYYDSGDSDAQSIKFRNAMHQAANEMLQENFGLMAGKFNPDTIGVDSTDSYNKLRAAIKKTRDNIKKIELFKENESNNIIGNKLIQLNNLLNEDAFKNLDFAKARIEEAKKIIFSIQNTISKDSGVKITSQNIESLNKIINEFNRDPLLYNQAGDLFE
jgi:hypothetical protein